MDSWSSFTFQKKFDVWDGLLRNHLEPEWKDTPIEHITIDAVNEWAKRARMAGKSWVTIKNAPRAMQGVLSALPKNTVPLFSQKKLAIPKKDELEMQVARRKRTSYSWNHAKLIAERIRVLGNLGDTRRGQYATMVLIASAAGLRASEFLALKGNDIDFTGRTIRVDEASDQRSKDGRVGPCKNDAAYRTVFLGDAEGIAAMGALKSFLEKYPAADDELIFRSQRGGPLHETMILNQAFYPALRELGLKQDGFHALRRGCNRRWELAGIVPVVLRQQMGHTAATMTALYSGVIPLEDVKTAFSKSQMENMENAVAA